MKKVQLKRSLTGNWNPIGEMLTLKEPLVLVFGNRLVLDEIAIYKEVREIFTDGHIVIGSTCGHVTNTSIEDKEVVVTAIEFENTNFLVKRSSLLETDKDSYRTGQDLMAKFPKENLKYVMIISEGSFVNGSKLAQGIENSLPSEVLVTGGLCGDAERFEKTITAYNEAPKEGEVVAVGFYGDTIEVSFSSSGGWTRFGPQRTITKSDGNVLYELDGKPALDLYKLYLGEKSKELPSAALLYPLDVKVVGDDQSIVRTVLGIDEEKNAMILAGDVPEESTVHLMMSNVDNIVLAAENAINIANEEREKAAELILFVSCIGRKLVLDQRVEEEVENVVEVAGDSSTVCGFYSYGEIVPFNGQDRCKLHNQTITLTLISE
ncbi:FIST signal transduction protein [Wenyingzhuangia sp. IMCC45574]